MSERDKPVDFMAELFGPEARAKYEADKQALLNYFKGIPDERAENILDHARKLGEAYSQSEWNARLCQYEKD